MNQMQHNEMIQTTDQSLAQQYGEYVGFQTDASPYLVEHHGEDPELEIKRLLPLYIRSNSRVLDIGCGPGHTLARIAPTVQAAWGIEQDPQLLQGAQERMAQMGCANVTLVAGDAENPTTVAQLPDNTFDVAYTESGPDLTADLLPKLTEDAYFLQEIGGKFGSYQLAEILGRKPYTYYAYGDDYSDQAHLAMMAKLDMAPICYKNYFYEWFFRDLAHLEAYVTQVDWALSDWRMRETRPYVPERDRTALELYARYNTTAKGVRILQQIRVFVWRREVIHYYPIDGTPT
ncbi:MAG: methyltransferase domain-containing protein [Caldilineaceae bacterium]